MPHKELIFATKWAITTWGPHNRKHYINHGFKFTKFGDRFYIPIQCLLPQSMALVIVICPLCRQSKTKKYSDVQNLGHSVCASCWQTMDRTGQKYNRLYVIRHGGKDKNGGARWFCQCDCGKFITVHSKHLSRGQKSCGCAMPKGKHHHNWNPKLTSKDRKNNRRQKNDIKWRKSVFKRDNYTCIVCNKAKTLLAAHHLYNWSNYPEHRINLDNGITLCQECHNDFHVNFMKGYNNSCTPQDLKSYLKVKMSDAAPVETVCA